VPQLVQRLRVVRALAGEDLKQDESERVDVGLDRGRFAPQLLGRHVLRRAGAHRRGIARGDGEPEVGDADVAVSVEHHVRRFQVAMHHAAFVRGGETGAQLCPLEISTPPDDRASGRRRDTPRPCRRGRAARRGGSVRR